MQQAKRVLIMAGGTGGHVFPALAVARALQQYGVEVAWLGTERGLESRVVPAANIPIFYLNIAGLRGKSWRERLMGPWRLFYSLLQALRIILLFKPTAVIGMGGFVSGPGGLAAWLLRKRLVIHEQNAKAGMTNQLLARIATCVLQAFPHTFAARYHAITTGNPLRQDIVMVEPPQNRSIGHRGSLRLLVVGGSLGAAAINELVPQALAQLTPGERPQVWHQAGRQHAEVTLQHYHAQGLMDVRVEPFIEDMATAYAWADVVLCRAGAMTIAELAAVGVGSVLVPYPYAVDDHQTLNAHYLVAAGAAVLRQQTIVTPEWLAMLLQQWQMNRNELVTMAEAAWRMRKPDATEQVVQQCLDHFTSNT